MEHFLFHILLLTYWFPTDRKSNESLSPIFFTILDTHSVIWELSEPLGRPSNLVIVSEWINSTCFVFYFSVPGLYSPAEMIDFGIIRTLDDPVTVSLNLVNTGYKPVHISVRQLASSIGSVQILASTYFSE